MTNPDPLAVLPPPEGKLSSELWSYHGEIPFPIVCKGCGARLTLVKLGGGRRYKHPFLNESHCNARIRFTVAQDDAIQAACRALRNEGLLRSDLPLREQFTLIDRYVVYVSVATGCTGEIVLTPDAPKPQRQEEPMGVNYVKVQYDDHVEEYVVVVGKEFSYGPVRATEHKSIPWRDLFALLDSFEVTPGKKPRQKKP